MGCLILDPLISPHTIAPGTPSKHVGACDHCAQQLLLVTSVEICAILSRAAGEARNEIGSTERVR